ncbi:MAG TPA: hypothetical protein VL426_07475 [Candidatus Binatia bacterium]|nr:hypothetical protein [Candidatus Binatia bacterium]
MTPWPLPAGGASRCARVFLPVQVVFIIMLVRAMLLAGILALEAVLAHTKVRRFRRSYSTIV